MKHLLCIPHIAVASFIVLVGANTTLADSKRLLAPTPTDELLVRASCAFLGTVLDIEKNPQSGPVDASRNEPVWKFARVRINEGFIGTRGLTQVRVGFRWNILKVGSSGCFFLSVHDEQTFLACATWEHFIGKNARQSLFQKSFQETLKRSRAYAKLMAAPKAGLRSKDPKARLLTAAGLPYRYRPVSANANPTTAPIDAEVNKLILHVLLQADWDADYDVSPWETFCLLGVTAQDNFDPNQGGLAWLKKHAANYAIRRVVRNGPPPKTKLTAAELQSFLSDLQGNDDRRIRRAMAALAAVPRQTIPFLRKMVKPAIPAAAERVTPLIADLDSKRYAVRLKAATELRRLGESAVPLLRKKLQEKPSLEVWLRIDQLLANAAKWTPKRLQGWRAVLVLEEIGSGEARRLLESLSRGAAGARITQEARAALKRLAGNDQEK